MKYFTVLLIAMSLVSCANDNMSDKDSDYLNCEQLLDTVGLKLYPFASFTEDEWRDMSFTYRLEQRQIPKDFLRGMSTKELFYQYVYCDLSKSMLAFNTIQQGFESTKRLNMLPELLSRSDAGIVLLELLQKTDPAKIEGLDGHWFYLCLNTISAQPEIINRMTAEEIDNYIIQQMRCHDVIQSLSATSEDWNYPESAEMIFVGFGNVMIRYKFEPFIQLIEMNDGNWWIREAKSREQSAVLIIDNMVEFINTKK